MQKDKYGPEYVVEVYDPKIGMEGYLVIDNTVLGPGKGGIRMTPNVTKEEVYRLARTMTWKNSLAGIPFGGAKAGIKWPPSISDSNADENLKKKFVQSFAIAVKPFTPKKYIAGPDVNMGEKEMQWFVEATNNLRTATGKPSKLCHPSGERCGLPHELGSTGLGVAHATAIAAELMGMDIKQTAVAIEGFGNVGEFTLRHLNAMGAKIVAITDIYGGVYDKNGLDEKTLLHLKHQKKSPIEYQGGAKIENSQIFGLPVDILIPAAVTDTINDKNKDEIRAKLIVEAANIPMKEHVENYLFKKGVMFVPDFVANAGGVISSYAEYRGYNHEKMFRLVKDKITRVAKNVMTTSIKEKRNPRDVAMEIAKEKVEGKMAD